MADEAPEVGIVLAVGMGVALGATVGTDLIGGGFGAVLGGVVFQLVAFKTYLNIYELVLLNLGWGY